MPRKFLPLSTDVRPPAFRCLTTKCPYVTVTVISRGVDPHLEVHDREAQGFFGLAALLRFYGGPVHGRAGIPAPHIFRRVRCIEVQRYERHPHEGGLAESSRLFLYGRQRFR